MANLDQLAHKFQFTGSLLEGALYIERSADRRLSKLLLEGRYCHVLGPRQIGKSSLRVKAARELAKAGVRCAAVDLTGIGSEVTSVNDWYFGLAEEISRRLKLDPPDDFWQASRAPSASQRWAEYLRFLLQGALADQRLVLFLDEIEAVQRAPIDTDDFFLTIRSLFDARHEDAYISRLSVCLMGVTKPSDLVKNRDLTPFNITEPVRLDDFTREQLDELAPGLDPLGVSTSKLLDEVHAWTDGHPYMTMRICATLVRRAPLVPGTEPRIVANIVHEELLLHPLDDPNLSYAAYRFDHPQSGKAGMLTDKVALCLRLLDGAKIPANNESDLEIELRLCGMIKDEKDASGHWLCMRNRIFSSFFDRKWFREKGDRRFIAEYVWKWLDERRSPAYVLRGGALDDALQWSKTALLSEDEHSFLEASQRHRNLELEAERLKLEAEGEKLEAERAKINAEVKGAQDRLAKTQRRFRWTTAGLVAIFIGWVGVTSVLGGRTREMIRSLDETREKKTRELGAQIQEQRSKLDAADQELRKTNEDRLAKERELKDKEAELEKINRQLDGERWKSQSADVRSQWSEEVKQSTLDKLNECRTQQQSDSDGLAKCSGERASLKGELTSCKQEAKKPPCEGSRICVSRDLVSGMSTSLESCQSDLSDCREKNR